MATIVQPDRVTEAAEFGEPPLRIRLAPAIQLTPDQYFEFCGQNRKLRLEQTEQGELIIMAPTGAESGDRNAEIGMQLRVWAKKDGTGKTFDSNTEYRLPRGSARCPDASWVLLTRWNALSKKEREVFPPLCPDFVLELRSRTDRLRDLQEKLVEYISNGARLGWIIDPFEKKVHIYRPQRQPEILLNPQSVSGEDVLPGFVLDLTEIFV